MKQLRSHNMLAGPANLKVPAGQYGALALRFSGTAAAGVTVTLAMYGNLTGTFRSTGFMSTPVAQMHTLNQHVGGVAEAASAVGAAFSHTIMILPSYVGDGNVFDVVETDEFYLSVDLAGISAATIAAGNLQLLGLPQIGVMAYLPHVLSQTANVPASGQFEYDIHHDNCGFIMLATLANCRQFEIMRDRLTEVQCTPAEALASSNYFDRLEVARTDDVLFNMVHSGLFDESLADDVRVKIYANAGGVAAPVITAVCYDPTPDLYARSKSSSAAFIAQTIARKNAAGKTRATAVHGALTGGGPAAG